MPAPDPILTGHHPAALAIAADLPYLFAGKALRLPPRCGLAVAYLPGAIDTGHQQAAGILIQTVDLPGFDLRGKRHRLWLALGIDAQQLAA